MCFEKLPCKALYSGKKKGLEQLPNDVGFIPNLSHYCKKTCLSYASETLAAYTGMCLHTQDLAHVCKPLPTYVGRGPLWSFYFQKIDFCSFKMLYFPF